jgi:hypothetical protein
MSSRALMEQRRCHPSRLSQNDQSGAPEARGERLMFSVKLLSTLGRVCLLTDLDAFFTDHHACGDLDAGVDGPIVWIACPCGASMARRVDV